MSAQVHVGMVSVELTSNTPPRIVAFQLHSEYQTKVGKGLQFLTRTIAIRSPKDHM